MILLFYYILYLRPNKSSTTMRYSNCGTLNSFRHLVQVYAKTCNNWRSTYSYPNILVCANCLIGYLIPALRTTGWELGTVLVCNSEIYMHQILLNDGVQEWVILLKPILSNSKPMVSNSKLECLKLTRNLSAGKFRVDAVQICRK